MVQFHKNLSKTKKKKWKDSFSILSYAIPPFSAVVPPLPQPWH